MLRLFVLRHGNAKTPNGETPDFNRPLDTKGVTQVNQIGYILKKQNIKIDQLISSGAIRTIQTTDIINFYLNVPEVSFDEELYLANKDRIEEELRKNGKNSSLMYVGHNIGISNFVNRIANDQLLMSTAMLIEIHFEINDWSELKEGVGTIKQIIEPQVHAF